MTAWTLPKLAATAAQPYSDTDDSARLQRILDSYKIGGKIVSLSAGPVVMRYEFEPKEGFRLNTLEKLSVDIGRSMSTDAVRIAMLPGKSSIGIEIPKRDRAPIAFNTVSTDKTLPLFLGQSISGTQVTEDLATMPHLLVAGTTGSGKSVSLNVIVASLLAVRSPDQLKLILIDPKMLELAAYADIPHLLFPVITDAAKAIGALEWAVVEMDKRYHLMSDAKVRNLAGYNQHHDRLPHIVIVVDEYADLLAVCGKGLEKVIQRLAQKARAAGIHIVLATQRPSVDVVTGVIKANFPARLCLRVISQVDSRTILNTGGAEHLLGKGDMILQSDRTDGMRIHGAYISDDQIDAIANQWRAQGAPKYLQVVRDDAAAVVQLPEVAAKPKKVMFPAWLCAVIYCLGTVLVLEGYPWGLAALLALIFDPTIKRGEKNDEKQKGRKSPEEKVRADRGG